jgi:two-component system sporulation sensor kinase A/two-component system, sporulation sensor kinase E
LGFIYVTKVKGYNDSSYCTIAQVVDITHYNEYLDENKILKSFYDFASEGIAIFDLEGKVIQVNRAFEVIFGYKEYEVRNKVLPVTPSFTMHHAKFLIEETKKGVYIKDFETIKQRKDGKLITVSINMSPIFNDDKVIVALAGLVRDISDEKFIHAQLESFIEYNNDPIIIVDNQGVVTKINNALNKFLGWTADDFIGKKLIDTPYIPLEYKSEAQVMIDNALSGKKIHDFETKRIRKDGTLIDVILSIFSIKDNLNFDNGFAISLRDITDKKRAAQIFLEAEKLTLAGQLAAGIAHEIRNPVTAIKGFIQLMRKGSFNEMYYEIVESEIERMELILNELLVLAKPQEIKFENANIYKAIDHVVTLLTALANMNSIEIINDLDSNDIYLQCDENQLKQVFINFIKNSIDAMPNGGRLIVRSSIKEGSYIIEFIDNGCGMTKEFLRKLGQPFHTSKQNGTGLGYMVSKSIIENHKGNIHVSSEKDVGTHITVTLPIEGTK